MAWAKENQYENISNIPQKCHIQLLELQPLNYIYAHSVC